jgi:hypothetical protein
VAPRSGRPLLLMNLRDNLTTVRVTLGGVKAEWIAIAFVENDARIAARTNDGKIFTWPFYPHVHSLEQLAQEQLPLVRDENGLEKRLEVPGFILRREHESGNSHDNGD